MFVSRKHATFLWIELNTSQDFFNILMGTLQPGVHPRLDKTYLRDQKHIDGRSREDSNEPKKGGSV